MSAANDAVAFWTCACGESGNSLLDETCVRCGREEASCRQCGEPLPDPVLTRWPDLCGVCGEEADQDEREDHQHERQVEREMERR